MLALIEAYAAGIGVAGLVVGYARISWDDPAPLGVMLFWPIALPVLLGQLLRDAVERRNATRKQIDSEKRKWLESPIP